MRKYAKKIVALVLAVILVAACFTGCAKINYVTNGTIGAIKKVQDGTWNQKEEAEGGSGEATAIEALKPDTYGGVEFKTNEDVVNYYVEAYNYTKTLTAQYKNSSGEIETCYKLLGEEKLELGTILIEGKENGAINNLAPGIVDKIMQTWAKGLPPNWSIHAEGDKNETIDLTKSPVTAEDVEACNVVENEDGTITLTIQPKASKSSQTYQDPQGKFFNVLGDIASTVSDIGVTFTAGDANDNVIVDYSGGTVKVTIDPSTKEIVAGEYNELISVSLTHANAFGIIKDKSAALDLAYKNTFPASDEYLAERNGLTRV